MKWQHLIQLNLAVLLFLLASGCSAYTRKKGRLDESGYVGLRLKTEGAYVRIIGVTVGSPGDKIGGLQPGMIILGIAENRTQKSLPSEAEA
ncbi:MAG: hypothetical protein NTZ16_13015 [Verrucomicrobia bacterium]|nr:hypothetical protein [Verrucomicrobiota bacterium]